MASVAQPIAAIASRIERSEIGEAANVRFKLAMPDFKTLADEIDKLQNQIYEIEAVLNGRAKRATTKYVFTDPSMIGRRW